MLGGVYKVKKFDIVIIGSGVGLTILDTALQNGMKCAIVENSKFGGTCLTKGCIPSKILVHPADIIREVQHASKVGIDFKPAEINWKTITKRMWSKIDESINIEKSVSNVKNLTVFKGTGEFTSPYTMKVKDKGGVYSEEFKAEKFVIAAGGRSFIPPIAGLVETGFVDYENFFGDAFPEKPWKSLVIVGGGAIGTEFAHAFSAFGTKVTIVEMQKHILTTEEEEISIHLEKQFEDNSVDVLTNYKVVSARKSGENKIITIQDVITGETKEIECEEIFISSGISSNADILKVEKTGVEMDSRGWIKTNEYLETSQKNIWALGDINGKFQFRHKANYEAEICVNNIFHSVHGKRKADYSRVPWAIFTCPQIAHVGITEKEALKKGGRIMVGKKHYSSVAKGFAMGYSEDDIDDGFVKLITDENRIILGVHIVGPYAAILIQPFIYLMNVGLEGGTIDPMYGSITIHPSLSELTDWVIGNLELKGGI